MVLLTELPDEGKLVRAYSEMVRREMYRPRALCGFRTKDIGKPDLVERM